MPKINVYLPDDLAARVKEAGLPVSRICQAALDEALAELPDPAAADPAETLADPRLERFSLNGHVTGFLRHATEAARQRGRSAVGTADILRGLLDEEESLILHALENAGFTRERITATLDRHDGKDTVREAGPESGPAPRFDPQVYALLERADQEATRRRNHPINGSHLLIALLDDDGPAGQTLRHLGVPEVITPVALSILSQGIAYGRATSGRAGGGSPLLLVALADITARLDRVERLLDSGGDHVEARPVPGP
ncbi:MAG: Clp protease N-terminal domain-containing protein [Aeromicrobium sp.]|uniref:Clp protease N-terminal domain-containing protein n=1 Tax=Aeromicrobium sp. TaxID=1871063 RepID=UPI0039E53FB9